MTKPRCLLTPLAIHYSLRHNNKAGRIGERMYVLFPADGAVLYADSLDMAVEAARQKAQRIEPDFGHYMKVTEFAAIFDSEWFS